MPGGPRQASGALLVSAGTIGKSEVSSPLAARASTQAGKEMSQPFRHMNLVDRAFGIQGWFQRSGTDAPGARPQLASFRNSAPAVRSNIGARPFFAERSHYLKAPSDA